jgi:hypothetical protein
MLLDSSIGDINVASRHNYILQPLGLALRGKEHSRHAEELVE